MSLRCPGSNDPLRRRRDPTPVHVSLGNRSAIRVSRGRSSNTYEHADLVVQLCRHFAAVSFCPIWHDFLPSF
ncbi:hypothetical protein BJV77DRAFT_985013, partial [Russula vinacea]